MKLTSDMIMQLKIGTHIENEHRETYNKFINYIQKNDKYPIPALFFSWIAQDHLVKCPQYYDYLKNMETEMEKEK